MLLNCGSPVKRNLQTLWPHLPNLQWLHSTAAGVEHILFPDLVDGPVTLTNAKVWVQCIHASGICQQTLVHLAVGTPGPFTCPMLTSTFRRLSCDDSVDCACKYSRKDGHAYPHQLWWCENRRGILVTRSQSTHWRPATGLPKISPGLEHSKRPRNGFLSMWRS